MFVRPSKAPSCSGRCSVAPTVLRVVVVTVHLCAVGASQEPGFDEDGETIDSRPGLVAVYRDGVQAVSRIDSQLAFRLHENESPHPLIECASWEADWTGAIDIRTPGRHRFAAEVQGEFELSIAGVTVLNVDAADATVPVRRQGAAIELPYGPSRIKARFRKSSRPEAVLRVVVRGPGGFEESVLPVRLQHAAADETDLLAEGKRFEIGRELLGRHACLACHHWDVDAAERLGMTPMLPGRYEPAMAAVNEKWLRLWMNNPRAVRPDARMPRLFGAEKSEQIDLAATLAVLTSSRPENGPAGRPPEDLREPGDAPATNADARVLFTVAGCAACHAFPGETNTVAQTVRRLDDVALKFSRSSLHAFLFNKQEPHGGDSRFHHRPRLDFAGLETAQMESLLDDLLSGSETVQGSSSVDGPLTEPMETVVSKRFRELVADEAERRTFEELADREQLIQLGQVAIGWRGCARCHREPEKAANGVHVVTFDAIVAGLADPASAEEAPAGCLSESPGLGVPDFGLTRDDRAAIISALRQVAVRQTTWDSPPDRLERDLDRLGCVSCHTRGGGASRFMEQAAQFVPLEPDQTLRDITPPSLDGIGERLRPEWLHAVLTQHRRVRPWLAVKMPRYEKEDVEPLVDLLTRSAEWTPRIDSADEPIHSGASIPAGRQIVGATGLNCIGCHDFGEYAPVGGVRAPDLTTAPQRLRFAWFRRWLHDPQSITPGTRMPSNFRNGRSALATVLDGSEAAQVDALWGYLSDLDRDPPLLKPSLATLGESDTPVPTDRPLLVHGFMPGHAGLRGIALGFPDGLHFAFDSETCSLTRVWTGPFVQHQGWTGSGKGNVNANAITILGEVVWRDDGGQPVRILSSAQAAAAVDHRFIDCWAMRSDAGFAWDLILDGGQRVRVEERPSPMPELGVTAFRRRLTIIDAPVGSQVAIRAAPVPSRFSDSTSSNMPVLEWVRLGQVSPDWLVRRLNPSGSEQWTVASNRSDAANSDVRELSLVATIESQSHVVELVYVRVPRGSEPPFLHDELSSKDQPGIQP